MKDPGKLFTLESCFGPSSCMRWARRPLHKVFGWGGSRLRTTSGRFSSCSKFLGVSCSPSTEFPQLSRYHSCRSAPRKVWARRQSKTRHLDTSLRGLLNPLIPSPRDRERRNKDRFGNSPLSLSDSFPFQIVEASPQTMAYFAFWSSLAELKVGYLKSAKIRKIFSNKYLINT